MPEDTAGQTCPKNLEGPGKGHPVTSRTHGNRTNIAARQVLGTGTRPAQGSPKLAPRAWKGKANG